MMWASAQWWIFFFSFPPFFPYCISYLLLAYVAEGLDIFVHTSFTNKHDIFFLLCVAEALDLEALILIVAG